MAPEQWSDAHTCDARADLYSLGCTLFLLLVGHPPYHSETHRSAANKMKGHVLDAIPDLPSARAAVRGGGCQPPQPISLTTDPSVERAAGERNETLRLAASPTSDIPDGLDAIYRKLMAKEPKDRFASADQLAEALAPFTRSSPQQRSPQQRSPQQRSPQQRSPQQRSPHAPREESRTQIDSPQRSNSDAAPAPSNTSPAPAIVSRNKTTTLGEAPVDQLGAAALVMLGVIIITITNKDGTKTKIEVPGDSKVEVANSSAPQSSILNLSPGTVGPLTPRSPSSRR